MAKLTLSYITVKGVRYYKDYPVDNWQKANSDFDLCVVRDLAAKLDYKDEKTPVPVAQRINKWPLEAEVANGNEQFISDLKVRLKNAGVANDKIETIATMEPDSIRNAIISKNVEAFTELKGVGEKTAIKVIDALYGKVTFGAIIIGNARKHFHERIRVTLNEEFGHKAEAPFWLFDSVKKRWSHLENYAAAISNDANCIIGVSSTIPESNSQKLEDQTIADTKVMTWQAVCQNGLLLNGRKYIVFAHNTNGAKDNNTLWCRAEYVNQVREEFMRHTDPEWQLTDAKHVAYLFGLQAVYAEPTLLPIEPENFMFFDSLVQEHIDDIALNHTDGSTVFIRNGKIEQNEFDGMLIFHVSDKMRIEFVKRLMAKGYAEDEANRIVLNELAKMVGHSMRADNAALKGVAVTFFDIHSFLHDNGVHFLQGRDIDDIVCFADETVLKTPIGEGKAYRTFEDWANSVRDGFTYKVLLKAHEFKAKDVPYQVIQSCYKANPETVKAFAREQADKINALLERKGAVKMLNKEQRALAKAYPTVLNHPYFTDKLQALYNRNMDTAFSGKRTGEAYIALLCGDAIAFAQHIAGLPVTGCLKAGDVWCPTLPSDEIAFWRNPVLDTGSLRIMNLRNRIVEQYAKYFDTTTTMMMVNIKDTTITRVRGDYDGDKSGFSYNKLLKKMFKEAHENFGDWLSDWDPLKTPKHIITRESQVEYFSNLYRQSDLGITCAGLNRLYNGIRFNMDAGQVEFFETTYEEVANATARGNNLVDASKHGMQAFAATKTIADKLKDSFQPQAKQYRDICHKYGKVIAAYPDRKAVPALLDELLAKLNKETNPDMKKDLQDQINRLQPILELEKLAKVPENFRKNTLNIYMGELCDRVERFYHLKDAVEGTFNPFSIMSVKEETRRGLTGFIRRGTRKMYVKELGYRLDEGLFNSIARRTARDWELIQGEDNDTLDRNISAEDYNAELRVAALAEIEQFAKCSGSTLQDAFDYVTWWIFNKAEIEYNRKIPQEKVALDQMWRAYWTIFGGMVKDAVAESIKETDPSTITDNDLKIA